MGKLCQLREEKVFMKMTWNEMVEKYPDSWLVITEVELGNEGIKSGVVYAICTEDELQKYSDDMMARGIDFVFASTKWFTPKVEYFEFD